MTTVSQKLSTATDNVADTMAGMFNALNLFASRLPSNYVRAFLAVAKDPGRNVQAYAKACNVGNGPMSRRLNDLGSVNRYRKPGFGLLESRSHEIDRRLVIVTLTEKGKAFAAQIARAVEFGSKTLR
jgi:hypothetical protein